ncbi:hypothetical protein AAFF_G00151000 [Aldrovandia affinis]|uniref:Uncharacterized protein n=1 Tax=Aldrovandia affinis TaxID=143900 RepID=A0AAD7VWZ3_9TELE|nr:hypothetical protein AAFF_G00151000 [Aldrovandia affinis]
MAETRHISIFPECYFDPDAVVWRAVREIIQELARLPVTRQHSLSEVVVDTVTSLFRTVMDDGEEPSNQTESSRPLSGVAVGATVTVLQDVHAVECRAMQEFPMQYSHSAGKGMVSALHRELLEQMGSPEALKVALRRKHNALSSTITTAITAAIRNLLTPPDATSPAMLLELQEYDIATPTDLDVLEVQQQLNETELDIATDTNTAMDIAITMETPLDIATSVQTVDRAASVEHLQDVVESVKPQLDLVEPSEMQDGCVVENAEILLDNAEGDDSQLEDLPQKVKKQKKGIQNFFSRVWKTLKDSALCCCCCCCCVSLESE